ncbi:MAG: hypothetical protein AAF934_01790 [Bacteroidota bacterium]
MEWYGPLTVLPALGLLILSTSNFIVALNNEITALEHPEKKNIAIIRLKLAQLKRLSIANAFLYAGALLFLIAGISKALLERPSVFYILMLLGVFATTTALAFLFVHALKSIRIRQQHLKL